MSGAGGGSAPKFTSKPSIKQTSNGVAFEVSLEANPAPEIVWYKGTTKVDNGGRFNIITQTNGNNYTLLLEVSNISKEDGGIYKVTAKNSQGESNANFNLNLESKIF